ncbi:hypothetical protein BV22DRAFT_162478 [Leucogyrophana mollusca]|uniref:Uncharacterized protein n=1 Tax=Leucogyrophana mollusca TaxID=85980 RepID=A0ACB8BST5_9AGAM|nr:hypothetical protein BV22DRAFT_162478 [Leucogyrophana mollusca]
MMFSKATVLALFAAAASTAVDAKCTKAAHNLNRNWVIEPFKVKDCTGYSQLVEGDFKKGQSSGCKAFNSIISSSTGLGSISVTASNSFHWELYGKGGCSSSDLLWTGTGTSAGKWPFSDLEGSPVTHYKISYD